MTENANVNNVKIGDRLYKYESVWRPSFDDQTKDSKGQMFPWPKEANIEWQNKDAFLNRLVDLQEGLESVAYESPRDCILCDKIGVSTKLYELNHRRWQDGLEHYIRVHNIKPSNEFIDFVFRVENNKVPTYLTRISGKQIKRSGKKYIKLDRNQILIMDALMEHGGYKIYKGAHNKNIYRYSEHAGLIDFNNSGVERIIISGKTNRVDENDDEIYLPKNMVDAFDYEYIFHTHPPTPKPGARVGIGILYEFPSISDIFHFIDHYNEGETQGSIVIAPEGMYIIKKKVDNSKKIRINEDRFYSEANDLIWKLQKKAIQKYGDEINQELFYSKIAQDMTYINKINKLLNSYGLHIDYYSRIKETHTHKWIIDTVYLPMHVIEP